MSRVQKMDKDKESNFDSDLGDIEIDITEFFDTQYRLLNTRTYETRFVPMGPRNFINPWNGEILWEIRGNNNE